MLSRPWQCDAFINDAIHSCVHGKESIVQKIENSTIFSEWFKEAVGCGTWGTNLRAAKHRFESWSKPLGRLIMHLPAVFSTAHRIISCRGEDAACIKSWLSSVDAEQLLQLAMCADAADEGMQIIRWCDTEEMDIADLNFQVGQFLARIDALFNHDHVLTQGYTSHCRAILAGAHPSH